MDMMDLSCREYAERLSSKSPVPGGGGTAALAGALAASLGCMVGSLTAGKKKYAEVTPRILELMEKAKSLEEELLELAQKDAEVFGPLSEAYGLPKDTDEAKAYRTAVMEKCLKDAAGVPLQVMEKCCECVALAEEFALKGSRLAVSDAGCGAALLRAALQSAALNVYINTRMMADRSLAQEMNAKAGAMLRVYAAQAEDVYDSVRDGLDG